MVRISKHRSLKPCGAVRMTGADLGAVFGGMFGRASVGPPTPAIAFPPLPQLPQTSFSAPAAPTPCPFSLTTHSSGGTGQETVHVIEAAFDDGLFFARGQVISPAVPAIPPMPLLNGAFTPALETHAFTAGLRFRF